MFLFFNKMAFVLLLVCSKINYTNIYICCRKIRRVQKNIKILFLLVEWNYLKETASKGNNVLLYN